MRATGPLRTGGPRLVALFAVVVLVAAACNRASEERRAALADSRVVHFESTDGVRLEGRLFGKGTVGVVLSHMLPADQSSWFDFAGMLAEQGYMALTYDFRGYCPGGDAGCSEGERDIAGIWQDVAGAVRFVSSQGARRIVLIGASMGGTASLVAAAREGAGIAAIVTLSAPVSIEGLVVDRSILEALPAAKLFLAGVGDAPAAASAEQLYDGSPQPKRVEILPSNDHGTDLLNGNQSEVVRTMILDELARYAPAS